jgi:hypothetical protein
MRSPIHSSKSYFTKFLSCIDGDHSACSHTDFAGDVTWLCQCECHPRDLSSDDNNYARFDPLPEDSQRAIRYSGVQENGVPVGLNACSKCGAYRGLCLQDQNPLRWHLGLIRVRCRCEK